MNTTVASPDLQYRYRYDGLSALRNLHAHFGARRWDNGPNPWPHAALIQALTQKPESHGIYRISFWVNEVIARRWLAFARGDEPQILSRVRLETLNRVFAGWNFEEDDHLRGQADLIWGVEVPSAADEEFRSRGIPLEDMEVWTEASGWTLWHLAEPLKPEVERMAGKGWRRVTYCGAWNLDASCYWRLLPDPRDDHAGEYWFLLASDELSPGSLAGDASAFARLMQQLCIDQLRDAAGSIRGVLAVELSTTSFQRPWTKQHAVQWVKKAQGGRHPSPWGVSQVARFFLARRRRVLTPILELRGLLNEDEVMTLIAQSALIEAKHGYSGA